MTPGEFTDRLGLCRLLPGPNIINVSMALDARWHGVVGFVVAFSGLTAALVTVMLALAKFLDRFSHLAVVRNAFVGMGRRRIGARAGAGGCPESGATVLFLATRLFP